MKKRLLYPMLLIAFAILLYLGLNNGKLLSSMLKQIMAVFIPFIIGFAIAFTLNVLLRPLERLWCRIWSKTKFKWPDKVKRPLCLTLCILIFIGVIFALLFMVAPEIANTVENFVAMLPEYIANLQNMWSKLQDMMSNHGATLPDLSLSADKIMETLTPIINDNKDTLLDRTLSITGSIFSGVVNVVLAFAFSIYVLAQKEKIGARVKSIMYAFFKEEKVDKVLSVAAMTDQTFTNFIRGQLTEAVIIGILCFIGMKIFRMPYAPIISVLVGATALIPMVGAFVGTGIGAFLILLVNPVKAIWFVVFIIVLQQIEGNLIYPKVVGKSVGLPGILVLAAVTIGGNTFGLVGMLLSVPVCAVLYTLLKQATESRLARKKAEKEALRPAQENTEEEKEE
ncbi:MAG: AI-2E family transporter [Butyrivibrio sp.]